MTAANASGEPTPVHDLIRQREQLRGWIAKLDEVRTEASERVAERVRGDYQARLARVTEELGTHREELDRNLAALRTGMDEADGRRAAALDALEETRLRHVIGELDDAAWDEARPGMENDAATAEEELGRARDEVERLSRLLAEIGGGDAADAEPQTGDGQPATASDASSDASASADADGSGDVTAAAGYDDDPAVEAEPVDVEPIGADVAAPEAIADDTDFEDAEEEIAPEIDAGEPFAEQYPSEAAAANASAEPEGDPFGNEFAADATAAAGEEAADEEDVDLPWLDALDRQTAAWDAPAAPKAPGWDAPPAKPSAWDAGAESDGLEFLNDVDVGPSTVGKSSGSAADAGLAADDLAFLEELDRAISGSPTPPPAPSGRGGGDVPTLPSGAPPAGRLLCKECGALNEPHAWYCEVCGSEL
ncbi:MAG TPA: hypothetical protein VFE05_23400 [Longimicrobiaceae bacterium]|jgi:hypothetical protein|nr:hypothetical protein [Longimicrobiaceae bacterium]